MKFGKMFKTILSLLLVLAMLVACAPAAEENNNNPGDSNNPGSSGTPGGDNSTQLEDLQGADYLQQLMENEVDASLASFKEIYAKILEGLKDGNAMSALPGGKIDLTLTTSADLRNLLEQMIFGADVPEMNFDFLSKINISTDMGMDGDMQKMQMALALNNQEIIKLNVIMNMAEYIIYAAAPDLNENWIVFDGSEVMTEGSAVGVMSSAAMMAVMSEALPDAETMTKVLDRYLSLIIPKLQNVEQSTVKLEAEGVQQECTALTLKIYEADALEICKAVLSTAKDDADLKAIIIKASEVMAEMSGTTANGAEAYADFQQMVASALSDMEDVEETDPTDPIVVTLYVDNNHKAIGAKLAMPDSVSENCMFYTYTLTSGDKTAVKLVLPTLAVEVSGSSTITDGKINGTCKVDMQGTTMATMKIENWDVNGGVLTITPNMEMFVPGITDAFGTLALQIKLNTEGIELNVLSNGSAMLGLALKATDSNGPDLSIPSDATDAMDSNAMNEWASNLNLQGVLDKLEAAGVPSELIEGIINGLSGGAQEEQPAPDYSYAA